jgi:hypothetical protein
MTIDFPATLRRPEAASSGPSCSGKTSSGDSALVSAKSDQERARQIAGMANSLSAWSPLNSSNTSRAVAFERRSCILLDNRQISPDSSADQLTAVPPGENQPTSGKPLW